MPTHPEYIQNESYSKGFISDVESLVEEARSALENVDFDTMAGRGLSGSLIIPVLARELGKHFFIVRKTEESSHTDALGEGRMGRRWVFVDDFVSSGATRNAVRETVDEFCRNRWSTEFIGSYLYLDRRFRGAQHQAY